MKKETNQFQPIIDAFFFYRHGLPKDKEDAINQYEVEALSFFKSRGLNVDIFFPEHDLINLAEEAFIAELQKHTEKWQALFKLPLNKEENNKLNQGVLNLATVLMNHKITNPSHMYWNVLIESGFPFVKRELLALNPINYPFPKQFRQVFKDQGAIELLADLVGSIKCSKVL